jgi:hypothetical protein
MGRRRERGGLLDAEQVARDTVCGFGKFKIAHEGLHAVEGDVARTPHKLKRIEGGEHFERVARRR